MAHRYAHGPTLFKTQADSRWVLVLSCELIDKVVIGSATRFYLRHKVGVNNTKIVKTSNLPSSIAAEHTQVWKLLNTP
jgi:hypothetical protein